MYLIILNFYLLILEREKDIQGKILFQEIQSMYENHQRAMKKAQNIIVFGNIIVPMGYGFCILVVIENCNHHLFCVPLVGAHIMIIIMHQPIGDY